MTNKWTGLWTNPLVRDLKTYPPGGDLVVDRIWLRKIQDAGDILHEKANQVDSVREFVLGRREDIEKDIEDLGLLKPVLEHFLKE